MHDWRHHFKVFPSLFKMVESFENLDTILHDWGKIKYKKVLSRHWTGMRVWKKKEKAVSFLENDSEKILEQSQSALNQTQNCSWNYFKVRNHRFVSNLTKPISKMFMSHQWHTWLSPPVPLICSYHILTSSVIYYWTDAWQHGISLLNIQHPFWLALFSRWHGIHCHSDWW